MTDKEKQDELILEGALWGIRFANVVNEAGGAPEGVFKQFSSESIQTMVRNGLSIHYEGKDAL